MSCTQGASSKTCELNDWMNSSLPLDFCFTSCMKLFRLCMRILNIGSQFVPHENTADTLILPYNLPDTDLWDLVFSFSRGTSGLFFSIWHFKAWYITGSLIWASCILLRERKIMIYIDYERGHKTLSETFQHQGVLPMTISFTLGVMAFYHYPSNLSALVVSQNQKEKTIPFITQEQDLRFKIMCSRRTNHTMFKIH